MGSSTEVEQRKLSPEEKALYAQQLKYMQTVQPGIDAMISKGMSNMGNTYTPDWTSLYNNYQNELNTLKSEQDDLYAGNLPSAYTKAKQSYYDNLYQNTMGKSMAQMAQKGVVNSSRFNTAAKDWQSTLSDQMSKDYSTDMNFQKDLLSQRYNWLSAPIDAASTINTNSRNDALDWFRGATNTQSSNSNALSSISNNESNRTYLTQSQGLFGGLAGGLSAYSGLRG